MAYLQKQGILLCN